MKTITVNKRMKVFGSVLPKDTIINENNESNTSYEYCKDGEKTILPLPVGCSIEAFLGEIKRINEMQYYIIANKNMKLFNSFFMANGSELKPNDNISIEIITSLLYFGENTPEKFFNEVKRLNELPFETPIVEERIKKSETGIDANNQEYSTNFMLDEIIDAFDEKLTENELIKKLTIQKIEYARNCMKQLIGRGGQTLQTMEAYQQEFDADLLKIIDKMKS